MNPFDLRGPEFLLVYSILAAVVLFLQRYHFQRNESAGMADPHTPSDPYQIAYLRGGGAEALRVAVVSLADRGLLKAKGDKVVRASAGAPGLVRRSIEKVVLEYFESPKKAIDVFQHLPPTHESWDEYRRELEQRGLTPSDEAKQTRMLVLACVLAVLAGVSFIKIRVALDRGHHNFLFLVGLTLIAGAIALSAYGKRRTANGDQVVASLKEEYSSLRQRALTIRPGGATNEAALLAAVFGLSALPGAVFPFARDLFPKASSSTGWSSGCSGGGCGGGGGGGGGGCGGGCGGCGG